MSIIRRQFGHPRGILGNVVGRVMARSNANINTWVVRKTSHEGIGDTKRIVELGPGPGVGLEEILRTFPEAQVWGVDLSSAMLS